MTAPGRDLQQAVKRAAAAAQAAAATSREIAERKRSETADQARENGDRSDGR